MLKTEFTDSLVEKVIRHWVWEFCGPAGGELPFDGGKAAELAVNAVLEEYGPPF